MFHCHNLIHEDHAMMAAFDVQLLKDFGYDEPSHFADAMEQQWRAKPAMSAKYQNTEVAKKINYMSSLEPYNRVKEVEEALTEYWTTHNAEDRLLSWQPRMPQLQLLPGPRQPMKSMVRRLMKLRAGKALK
jgi:hypothetical protein